MNAAAWPERESDWLHRQIVDGAPDAVVVADRDGVIRLWNRAAERIFGYTAAEALGQTLDLIIPERLRQRHWDGYRRVMATGQSRDRTELLAVPATRKDGERLSLEFTVTPLRGADGGLLGIAAILRDVTARWRETQELRRRLAMLEAQRGQAATE